MTTTIDLSDDIIDIRTIIERVEELENEIAPTEAQQWDNRDEYAVLTAILDELEGAGGDEEWRGSWYPATLIRESHFVDYAEELACDCGDYPKQVRWPYTCIDWDQAARELQHDYTPIDIDGATYFYR
jgi:hypothetical protein